MTDHGDLAKVVLVRVARISYYPHAVTFAPSFFSVLQQSLLPVIFSLDFASHIH